MNTIAFLYGSNPRHAVLEYVSPACHSAISHAQTHQLESIQEQSLPIIIFCFTRGMSSMSYLLPF